MLAKTELAFPELAVAADEIERFGWYREGRGKDSIGICPKEAIYRATSDPLKRHALELHMERYLGCRVDIWNYTPGLTQEIIVRTFREAALYRHAAANRFVDHNE